MINIEKINLEDKVNLTLINSKKFKTNLVSVYIQRLLDKNEATKNALIPNVVMSGSMNYKSRREISIKSDNLYGSSLFAEVSKRGERQILSFKMVSTNERYLDENIFSDAISFLNEVINNPLVTDGGFKKEYLDLEKKNLKDIIKSKINDKSRYALERCFEEMCKDERLSISEYGYEEDIDKINEVDLYNHYKNILKTSQIEIVVEGEFDKDKVVSIIKEQFVFERDKIQVIPKEDYYKEVKEIKEIEDNIEVNQGKIVIGYRANVDFKNDELYYPLVVGCNVLGGGPHSKLFMNVREKESLCYYIYSSIEKYKSIMFISSGIEINNYDKARKLINIELDKIISGDINEEELRNSKNAIINSVKSVADSLGGLSDFYFAQAISESKNTIEDMIEKVEKVTVDDIVKSFKNIQLDTVYFLRD